jgi:glycosyltransferase involved in cell wall biosynthesis
LTILANVPAFYFGISPNKFCDDIGAGVPVLSNYPGWLAGMIQQQQCGLAVQPESAVELANSMEYLAGLTPDERQTMVMQGRALAEREFSWEKRVGTFVEFLEKNAISI